MGNYRKEINMLNRLKNHFEYNDEQLEFLSWMDDSIFDNSLSLETMFNELYVRFKTVFKITKIGIYAISENHWYPFKPSVYNISENERPFIPKAFQLSEGILNGNASVIKYQKLVTLFIPIMFNNDSFILIVLQDDIINDNSNLTNDIVPFAQEIANKLTIIIHFKEEKRIEEIKNELISDFFSNQLGELKLGELQIGSISAQYWERITDFATLFLPDWGPFKIDPPPLVQVLTYNEGDRYMILQPSKNQRTSIPLKVEDTISGLLVQQKKDILYVNPEREYQHLYKAYLFGANIPRSELVISVHYGNKIIGLLNLEHMNEEAFSQYHKSLLRSISDILSPMIAMLILQQDIQRSKEVSIIYIMSDLLKRMVSMYRHKVNQLFPKSLLTIEEIGELAGNDRRIQENLIYLRKFIEEFEQRTKTFLQDLPYYMNYGPTDICQQVKEAVNEFDPEALRLKENIFIDFHTLPGEVKVYASPLLREHVYNLLKNSIDAIQDFMKNNMITEGRITISMRKERVMDAYDKETSPPRIYVQLDDNGGGVPEEYYPHIMEYSYTTKRERGGTGLGLAAARDYMRFADGDLDTKNYFGKGFSVIFYLQEFDPSCHKELTFKRDNQ